MTYCVNCDHDRRCHEIKDGIEVCFRLFNNTMCKCARYGESDRPTGPAHFSPGADIVFGTQTTDLSPYFQDMIRRMMHPDKLSD